MIRYLIWCNDFSFHFRLFYILKWNDGKNEEKETQNGQEPETLPKTAKIFN